MCHRSVGLVQGEIERAGIPTVSLTMRPEITANMKVSRAAWVRFPLGNPLGEPHQPAQHHLVLSDLLHLLETATEAESLVELPYRWRRWGRWI
jgi:D-proline reductase (dithiol) PrdB